jgi:hypothetical protein
MTYNTHTQIVVINNFAGSANITLKHQYSDGGLCSNRWLNITPNGQGQSAWTVYYNTGFIRYGDDYWSVQAEVQAGDQQGVWRTDTFSCTLHSDDANQTLQCNVGPGGISITRPSGNCQQAIAKQA